MDKDYLLELHARKVEEIARDVKYAHEHAKPGEYFSLRKASVSHMAPQPGNPRYKDRKFNVKDLVDIIDIDEKERTCIAESGVTFEKLVRHTLRHGLVPACVSELKEITIGGAVAGCSVESMSFKHGGFHDSCLEYEVVTGTGEVLVCSREKNQDVFEAVHGSFGTIGIITLLKFKLIPAKPFIRIDYVRFEGQEEYLNAIKDHHEARDVEMMDGLVHGPADHLLCIGTFVDEAPYTSRYFFEPYYKSTRVRKRDFMKTYDYFFRYDADCHWSIRNYPGMENKLFRLLFGNFFLGSTNILRIGEKFPFLIKKGGKPDVIVDVFIPFKHSSDFLTWCKETYRYYPLWVVPYHLPEAKMDGYRFYPWLNQELVSGIDDPFFIDFAIYGFVQPNDGVNYYKILEEKVFELKGMKTLITHNYYEEDMFWGTFNKDFYQAVKEKTDPKNLFRDLYHKTNYKRKA